MPFPAAAAAVAAVVVAGPFIIVVSTDWGGFRGIAAPAPFIFAGYSFAMRRYANEIFLISFGILDRLVATVSANGSRRRNTDTLSTQIDNEQTEADFISSKSTPNTTMMPSRT